MRNFYTHIAPYTKENGGEVGDSRLSGFGTQVGNVKVWQINILSSRRFEVEDATIEG